MRSASRRSFPGGLGRLLDAPGSTEALLVTAVFSVLAIFFLTGSEIARTMLVGLSGAVVAYALVGFSTHNRRRGRLVAGLLAFAWAAAAVVLALWFPGSFPIPAGDSILAILVYGFMFAFGIAVFRRLIGLPLSLDAPGRERAARRETARGVLIVSVPLLVILALAFVTFEHVIGPLVRFFAQ